MTTMHTVGIRPGLELRVRDAGQGPAVLLLHGAPGPASVTPLAHHLISTGHRVLSPTHPGWDFTTRPEDLDSVAALASVYHELLAQFGLRDVTVIGTSFGGWAAVELVLADQEKRISKLVLMNAIGPEIPGHSVTLPSPPPRAPGPAGAEGRSDPPAHLFTTLHAYTGPAMNDPGLLARLPGVQCPALVLWGSEDTVIIPGFGRAYAAALPHAEFVLIPGGGHLPIREQAPAVFAALDTFLS
ncbi:alpha/beta fold hydrolase [Streptomyces sp. WAC8370]|uniref:alpha/beta fold hydrolase n=1 Tax=Streptomyces TaxID=1883 RepID=UPI0006E2F6B9|nr:alpha/beta hydrolase [Streptomyces sp. NBRC 110030]